jgi:hypothetical protein
MAKPGSYTQNGTRSQWVGDVKLASKQEICRKSVGGFQYLQLHYIKKILEATVLSLTSGSSQLFKSNAKLRALEALWASA